MSGRENVQEYLEKLDNDGDGNSGGGGDLHGILKNTSLEQNKETRNKPLSLWSIITLKRVQEHTIE